MWLCALSLIVLGLVGWIVYDLSRGNNKGRFYARELYVDKAVIVKRYEGTEFECMNCSSVKMVTVQDTHWVLSHKPCSKCRQEVKWLSHGGKESR